MSKSYEFNIHGVVHKVRMKVVNNEWYMEILGPGGYVENTRKLASTNTQNLQTALKSAIKAVNIDHQVTEYVVDALVELIRKKLSEEGISDAKGFIPEEKREVLMSDEISEIKSNLARILREIQEINLRLERIETRVGL